MLIKKLLVPLTMRCNLNCDHCYLGERINKELPADVIDALWKGLNGAAGVTVDALYLIGAESQLASKETLDRFFSAIIDNNVDLRGLSFVTNGTCCDPFFASQMARMNEYIKQKTQDYDPHHHNIDIAISGDVFHRHEITEHKLSHVRMTIGSRLKKMMPFAHVHYQHSAANGECIIQPVGKAKDLVLQEQAYKNGEIQKPYWYNYAQVWSALSLPWGNLAKEDVEISMDGNLLIPSMEMRSLEEQSDPKNIAGSILDTPITELLVSNPAFKRAYRPDPAPEAQKPCM
jgi:hypothetical protein